MVIVFKKVWPELQPYIKSLVVILLLGLVSAGFKSASPPLMKILTGAWTSGDLDTSQLIPWVLAGVWMAFALLKYVQVYWLKYISDKIAVKLRKDLMDKYLSLNLGFFQDFVKGSGGLISRMINDIAVIQGGIHKFADLLREPFIVVFCLIQIIIVDWKLTLFIFVAMPVIITILKNIARSLRKYGHKNQESMEDLTKTLKESLDGTRIVQSFNLQTKLRDRFQKQAHHFLETRKKIISREEAAGPASESLSSLALAFLLVYLGHQVIGGALQIDDFVGFLASIGLLSDSIRKIQGGYVKLQQASVGLERMHSILEKTNSVPDTQTPKPFPKSGKRLNLEMCPFLLVKNPS